MSSLTITERTGEGNLGDGEGKGVPGFSSFAAHPYGWNLSLTK